MTEVLPENEEAQRAWDGVLFDRFVLYRDVIVDGLAQHGLEAIRRFPPPRGARVVDIGCGFGDSAVALAERVGAEGSALGVDISPRFVEAAAAESEQLRVHNVRFAVMDVQASRFEERFDYAFSRFGTMFFASPVAAMRNVHDALEPGGRLVMVVWRKREDNPWVYEAERVVKPLVDVPDDTDEARCGPGPFSMAGADLVSTQLQLAGFRDVSFLRIDLPFRLGATLDDAIDLNLALGPGAEAVRLAGADGDALKPRLRELLRPALAPFVTDDGVVAQSSVWVVTATS